MSANASPTARGTVRRQPSGWMRRRRVCCWWRERADTFTERQSSPDVCRAQSEGRILTGAKDVRGPDNERACRPYVYRGLSVRWSRGEKDGIQRPQDKRKRELCSRDDILVAKCSSTRSNVPSVTNSPTVAVASVMKSEWTKRGEVR